VEKKDLEAAISNNIETLQNLIQKCERCGLYKNGRAMPFIDFKYYKDVVMVFEAPGGKEKDMNTPVVGMAGQKLWSIAQEYNMYRENFAIINSVNCRPIKVNEETKRISNGKPTYEELKACKPFVEAFIRLLNPKLIVAFGGYAIKSFLYEDISVKRIAGEIKQIEISKYKYNMLCNVHPASLHYDAENMEKFRKAMKVLGGFIHGHQG
jgi:uracil-DNA glycosylase